MHLVEHLRNLIIAKFSKDSVNNLKTQAEFPYLYHLLLHYIFWYRIIHSKAVEIWT